MVLHLDNNLFETIPIELTRFKYLSELSFSYNKIFFLTQEGLNMESVIYLDLSSNSFPNWNKIINDVYILLPPKINTLKLSDNHFGIIDKSPVLISTTLKDLYLEGCGLTNISSGFLRNLTSLKSLNIARNKLKHISFSSESLTSLDLSSNSLSYLPMNIFVKFPNLEKLSVSYNHIRNTHLPVSMSLLTLDMSYCNIEKINVTELHNLKTLKLRGNYIGRIHENYFINEKLETLDLSRNSIEKIDTKAFTKLKYLIQLDISTNLINFIHPDTFLNNVNLLHLDLSRNYITTLNFRVPFLIYLNISNCEIQTIDDKGLSMIPFVQKLLLSRNLISKLPDKIKLDHLRHLDLSSNRLSSIKNTTFSYLITLDTLNLRDNRFTSIFKTFYFPPSLSLIHLDDNLWHCNCFAWSFKAFYDYLIRPPSKVTDNYKLTCHSPENISGHPWHLSCSYVWNTDINQNHYDKIWLYISVLVSVLTLLACVVMTIRKMAEIKAVREHTERERQAEEARERMRRLRNQHRQEAQQNAPDPRELARPPSYAEAILLPRIDSTSSNLNSEATPKKSKKNKKRRTRKECVETVEDTEPKPESSRPVENNNPNQRLRIGTDDSDTDVEESIRRLATKNDVIESDF